MRLQAVLPLVLACSASLSAQTYTGRLGAGGRSTLVLDEGSHATGTVVVAVALSDGLVLAADSRLTLTYPNTPGYKIASDYAPKLFSVGQVAIGTYGEAFLLGRSIASFISEFEASRKSLPPTDIDETAKALVTFFGVYYDKQSIKSPLGFILVGYDKNGVGKVMTVDYPGPREAVSQLNTNTKPGAMWRGQIDVISRLLLGYDPALGSAPAFLALSDLQRVELAKELTSEEYNIPYNYLMLQDGIDFALTLVQTTVNMQRFSYGTVGQVGAIPGVGGTVDVLAVTPLALTWVRKKALTAN